MKSPITLLIALFFLLCARPVSASHLYGGELYYTHLSGSLYRVTMILYGDCAGSIFSTLSSVTPEVKVYKGTSLSRTLNLKIQSPSAGVEITPVCPSSLGSTTCNGGSIPGVKKFIYTDTITLTPATNWKIQSTGTLSTGASPTSSGRSSSITNIFSSTGSIMVLEATLNNSSAANSSPTYTTVPTPFFCINTLQEYNPGAVDADAGDSLRYALVDGLEGTTGTVTYRTGYSATTPLASAAGTFAFSGSSGQLTFKPNLTQVSMVVYKVSEYRSGVLVGTSMREMNFIVLSGCSNRSPSGSVRNVAGGTLTDSFSVRMCKNDTLLTFNINPVDSDGNAITMSVKGLPAGATLSITGNGTTAPTSSFSWNTGSIAPGTYYFYVTYQDDGCPISSKQTIAYTIQILGKPSASVSIVSGASCIAKSVIDLTPYTGSPPWTIQAYSGTTLLHTLSGTGTLRDSLDPGTYLYRITSAEGCWGELTHIVTPPGPVNISLISPVATLCKGSADGKVTITPGTGKPSFQYQVDGGAFSSSSTITGLSAGTHTLRVQDANSCFKDTSFYIGEPELLSIASFSATHLKCFEVPTGTAGISAAGGTPFYSFSIDGGFFISSGSFSSLYAGSHTITIKDINGCTKDTSFVLTQSPKININSLSITQPLCNGDTSGALSFSASGGTPPYQYSLNGGSYGAAASFTGLTAGAYVIRIRDSNLCVRDTTVAIYEPAAVDVASLSIVPPACKGMANGSVTVSATGGTTPYTYRMGSGTFGTSATFSGLADGTYTITIRDAHLCTKDISVVVTEPGKLQASSLDLTPALCKGTASGTASVGVTGGTSPFQYKVDGGSFSTSSSFTSLAAGTHTIYIQDVMSCTTDTTFTITEPAAVGIKSFVPSQPLCKDGTTGSVTVVGDGGTSPYTYSSDGGPFTTGGLLPALGAGVHTIRIRDKNYCTHDTTFTLGEPDSVSAALSIEKAICKDVASGAISVLAAGGVAPYQYSLNGGTFGSSKSFGSLLSGTHTITIKDTNNCIRTYTAAIADSIVLDADLVPTGVSCFGWVNGSVSIFPLNGAAPYSYAIGTGGFKVGSSIKALSAGTYTVKVKDALGCLFSDTVTIVQPSEIAAVAKTIMPLCKDSSNGSIEVLTSGGTPGYTYSLDGSAFGTSGVFPKLADGTYTVSVRDAQGCTKDMSVSLVEPTALALSVEIEMPLCHDGDNGSVKLITRGGTPSYLYTISGGPSVRDSVFLGISSGSYPVSTSDGNGCRKDTVIFVGQPTALSFQNVKIVNPTCDDYANGFVSADVLGGTRPLRYTLGTHGPTSNSWFTALKTGTYTLTVTDTNNCMIDTVLSLKGYPAIILDSIQSAMPACFGKEDGSFRLYVSGGTAPIRFVAADATGDTLSVASFDRLKAGTYVVKATDAMHCAKDFAVHIDQPEALAISLSVVHNDCTGPASSGRITAAVSGGTGPYRYLWSPQNQGDSTISGLANGPYSVWVQDVNGCMDSADTEIVFDNCCKPSVPNAFTPNHDGINDVFRILYTGDIVLKEFIIYNRYGQQVFSTTNINQGWDGTFMGKDEMLGVYYYYIRLKCGNGKDNEVMFKGDVTLVR